MRRCRQLSSIAECKFSIPETWRARTKTTPTTNRRRSVQILISSFLLLLLLLLFGVVPTDSTFPSSNKYPTQHKHARQQQYQRQTQQHKDIFVEYYINRTTLPPSTTSTPPTPLPTTTCTDGGQDPWNTPTGIERPCCPAFISCLAPWSTTDNNNQNNNNNNKNDNANSAPRWHYLCVLPLDCPTLQVTPTSAPPPTTTITEEPQVALPALPPSHLTTPTQTTDTPTVEEEPQISLPALPPSFEFVLNTPLPTTTTPTVVGTTISSSPTKAPVTTVSPTTAKAPSIIMTTPPLPTKLPTLPPTTVIIPTIVPTTAIPALPPTIKEVSLPVLPPSEPTLSPTTTTPVPPPPKKSSPSPTTFSPTYRMTTPVPSEVSSIQPSRRHTILPTLPTPCRKPWCRPSSTSSSSPTTTTTTTTTVQDDISPSPSLLPTIRNTVPPTLSSSNAKNDNTDSQDEEYEDNDTNDKEDTDTDTDTSSPLQQRLTLPNVQLDLSGGQIMNLNTQVNWQIITAQQILEEVLNVNGNNPSIIWDARVAITVLLQTSIGSDVSFMVVEPLPRTFMESMSSDGVGESSDADSNADADSDEDEEVNNNNYDHNRHRQLLDDNSNHDMVMVDSSVPTILHDKHDKDQVVQQPYTLQRQLEDNGNILRINFDVMIAFKSILENHNVERYVLGAFNTYQDQDNYRTALQDTGNPSFQDITTITASLPTSSMNVGGGGATNGNNNNGVDGALGENDTTSSDHSGRLGGISRIQGKTAIVGGILIGICVLALMGVLYVVNTKYYTQRQHRHQRLDHPYFGSDYTPRTPHTAPPSPPGGDEHDRRRRRRRESSTTSSLFTSLPVWNIFRKKKQQHHHQQQQSPYDGTWTAAIHQNHFSSVEINIEPHGEQSDVSTLHDPIPPGEDQLSLEEDNTAVFSYDYKKAHGIGVIGTEDSSSEGFSSPQKSSSEQHHQRPLIMGGIPTITPDPDNSSPPHNNHNSDDDGGSGSGATSPLMATTIPTFSNNTTKSNTSTTLDHDPYSITEDPIEINAPSGKLGLILETAPHNGVPTVTKVKHGSPLEYQVKVDDKLLSVDGLDVTVMKGREVSKLIASKQDNYVRRFIFSRPRTKKHLDTVLL